MEDSGEMRRDIVGKVHLCTSTLLVEVYNDTGWISDGVHEMSRNHFAQGQRC